MARQKWQNDRKNNSKTKTVKKLSNELSSKVKLKNLTSGDEEKCVFVQMQQMFWWILLLISFLKLNQRQKVTNMSRLKRLSPATVNLCFEKFFNQAEK